MNTSICGIAFRSIGYLYALSPATPFLSFINCVTAFTPVPVTLWYVLTTILFTLYFLCNGSRAITICIVEQFGLAMILSFGVSTSALISGTTSGLEGSILQAEELSITVMPASANFGAHSS